MRIARPLAALACTLLAQVAQAEELKILSAGAFKPVVVALQPAFERDTGHKLVIENDTAGGLQKRITGGEAFDLVFSSPASLQPMAQAGKLANEAPLPLARVAINIDRYGNTLAASIPIALDEALAQNLAGPGDIIALVGFGAGLAWGGVLWQL